MTISVCIASRGRPLLLQQTVRTLCANMTLSDTLISIALDQEDKDMEAVWTPAFMAPWNDRLLASVEPREDSLGAKYNRAQTYSPADLYVLWADDMIMPDRGWDAKLAEAAARLTDQCGIVLFGQIPGVLQPGLAMTQKFIDAQGFFCPPYFPAWFHETWALEIADGAGCHVKADVAVELLQETIGKSRGIRDVEFWATLFDAMRSKRREIILKLIENRLDKLWRFSKLTEWDAKWSNSNSVLRDPNRAKQIEQFYSFDAPDDLRYQRLRTAGEELLCQFTR